tara:strand:+ start:115 stop:591 length:477 start_codon:yes stop_codon:yes gene_type:complete
MATYIKPTITLTANKQSATSNPGPLSVALALSTTDLLTVDNVQSQIYDVDTGANVEIANGSELSAAFVPGVNGAFVYLKNVTASGTDKICVGVLNEGVAAPAVDNGTDDLTRSHADSHRMMSLMPGEFAFFPWDYCGDIYAQATVNNQSLEVWIFDRG